MYANRLLPEFSSVAEAECIYGTAESGNHIIIIIIILRSMCALMKVVSKLNIRHFLYEQYIEFAVPG